MKTDNMTNNSSPQTKTIVPYEMTVFIYKYGIIDILPRIRYDDMEMRIRIIDHSVTYCITNRHGRNLMNEQIDHNNDHNGFDFYIKKMKNLLEQYLYGYYNKNIDIAFRLMSFNSSGCREKDIERAWMFLMDQGTIT